MFRRNEKKSIAKRFNLSFQLDGDRYVCIFEMSRNNDCSIRFDDVIRFHTGNSYAIEVNQIHDYIFYHYNNPANGIQGFSSRAYICINVFIWENNMR